MRAPVPDKRRSTDPGWRECCRPDVAASRLGPQIVNRLHASYSVECETSGLGGRGKEKP
jgi:hypothetical protein